MYSKFGKNAEGAINNKIYQLLREPELGESQLKAAEKDIECNVLNPKPMSHSKSPKRKEIEKEHKTIKRTGQMVLKRKPFGVKKKEEIKLPKVGSQTMVQNTSFIPCSTKGQSSPTALINSNYGISGPNFKPISQLSGSGRMMTPSSKNFNIETSSTFKEKQERRNSSIWDAIAHIDYKSYVKEEDAKRLKRREQQENIKNFLDKQVKELQFKKSIQDRLLVSEHNQILEQIKKYDENTAEKLRKRKNELASQVQTNIEQSKRKIDMKIMDKTQDIIMDNYYQTNFQKTAKIIDNNRNNDIIKIREDRQKDFEKEISVQQKLKSSTKVLTKLEHLANMDSEFDLISKNQDRYKQKIKELVQRNDMIYNNVQKSPYKNLAIAEQERENQLKLRANQSFIDETQKRSVEYEGIKRRKQREYMDLRSIQK